MNFEGAAKIATMATLLSATCAGVHESPSIFCSSNDFDSSIEILQTNLKAANAQNAQLVAETTKLTAENLKCNLQVGQILDLQEKWEMRWDATYATKTGEFREELRKKNSEIDDKNRRIRVLERQIEALSGK